MKQKLIVAVVLTAASFAVTAQSSFEGFYGQLGIGYESVSATSSNYSVTESGITYPFSTPTNRAQSFTGTATVGYTFAVSQQFLLGLGAEYSPIAGQSANYSISNPHYVTTNGSYKKNNSYNIFLSPATPIGKDGLIYGKVGYTGIQMKDNLTGSTGDYTGYSLGLGYKQFISGGLYGFAEGNYFSYGNKSNNNTYPTYSFTGTTGVSSYNLLLGVGYRF